MQFRKSEVGRTCCHLPFLCNFFRSRYRWLLPLNSSLPYLFHSIRM